MADSEPVILEPPEAQDALVQEIYAKRIGTLGLKKNQSSEKNIGMEVVRNLDPDERKLLTESFEASRHHAVPKDLKGELYWLNYYVDRKFVLDFPQRQEMHEWVVKQIETIYEWPEYHIISYGFIISPPGGTVDQRFHYDYTHTSSNLFVPLTKLTPLNATQYLTDPLKAHYDDIQWLGDAEDLMEKEGRPIEIHQVIVPSLTLLRLRPGTPHRGIANRDNYTRILFFCTLDRVWYPINEKAYSQKDDAF